MAGRRTQRPRGGEVLAPPDVKDTEVSKALAVIVSSVVRLQERPSYVLVDADLVVGRNAVPHSLGRAPRMVILSKTVADASFDFALVKTNKNAHRQVLIDLIGVDQPNATLLLI